MARAWINEFADVESVNNMTVPKWSSRTVEQSMIADIATSQQSAAFNANTRYILFTADVPFSWTMGTNPTATTSKMRFAADTVFFISVPRGDSFKIALITNT